jgi:methionyl-tRNA formyltransferase
MADRPRVRPHSSPSRLAFAGDRDVSVNALGLLLELGDRPAALLLPDEGRASHDSALVELCERSGISPPVLRARQLGSPATTDFLRTLGLDYIVCVHFPYILRPPVLGAARCGVLNLHPAYLPYNRGWHTPTWAILDETPAGASFHYMSESLDAGDVVYQEKIAPDPGDTAHTLYLKLKALEVRVFREGWQLIRNGRAAGVPQTSGQATIHRRQDLFDPSVQRIDLDKVVRAEDLLRRLRALTTSRLDEAAYFESGARKYRVQVTITPDGGI